MISRFGLIERKAGLSDMAFHAHWRNVHGPLAAQLPGLQAYYQNRIVDDRQFGVSYQRGAWDLDGFSELQFEDIETMKSALASAPFSATVQDADLFLSRVRLVVCEKHVVVPLVPTEGPVIKRMSLLRRHPHLSQDAFRREWIERHAEMIAQWPDVLGYNQNLIVDRYASMAETAPYEAVPVDGIVEFWFRSEEDADTLYKSDLVAKTQEHGREFLSEVTPFFVKTDMIFGNGAG